MSILPPLRGQDRATAPLLSSPHLLFARLTAPCATALDAEAATIVTYDPRLRDAAAPQRLFLAPEVFGLDEKALSRWRWRKARGVSLCHRANALLKAAGSE